MSAANKNGILYAFLRDNISAGPVWSTRLSLAAGGTDPGAGGVYSNGFFDGHRLYYAGGETTIGGEAQAGFVRAIDPTTGRFLWERPLPSRVYGALTGANGMIVVPGVDALYLVNANTGEVTYGNDLGRSIYGPATIAGGRLFVGDTGGRAWAFRYPTSATAAAGPRPLARRSTGPSSCGLAAGRAPLAVDCRLAVSPRCTPLGTVPAAEGSPRVSRIVVRDVRRAKGIATVVRVYANRDCRGRPALRIKVRDRRGVATIRGGRPIRPSSSFSATSSRPITLQVRIEGRPGR